MSVCMCEPKLLSLAYNPLLNNRLGNVVSNKKPPLSESKESSVSTSKKPLASYHSRRCTDDGQCWGGVFSKTLSNVDFRVLLFYARLFSDVL